MTNAAGRIWPHLQTGDEPPKQQQRASSPLAAALYPSLVPQPKPPPNPARESLLRGLRELNATIDARLQREGRR